MMMPPQATVPGACPQVPVGPSSGRLKYADPRDLPSFPSLGLRENDAAAGAAASLGWASHKPVEPSPPRKPKGANTAVSASAAALLATDHDMPLKKPENSDSCKAARLAAGGAAGGRDSVAIAPSATPVAGPPPSTWGSSAANQAFRADAESKTPTASTSTTTPSVSTNRRGSLRAAKGAMAAGRPRARSSPTPKHHFPDDHDDIITQPTKTVNRVTAIPSNTATAALTAATIAHRRTASMEEGSGAVPYTTLDRQMFTSNPPVRVEVEEQRHAEGLHASAVAMAKRMYSQQSEKQLYADALRAARAESPSGPRSPRSPGFGSDVSSPQPSPVQPVQFGNLQEAAYKLAQDRLAKLHEEHQRTALIPSSTTQPLHQRFTFLGKLRRRSSSDGMVFENRGRLRRRSLFADVGGVSSSTPVDDEKRARDRQMLLAAARRNVQAQIQGIDRKVFAETGKASPALQGEWEHKARALAKSRSEALVAAAANSKAGKVDIGGGKYMDQKEIDEIAARKVQPFLDEINEKAEKERERLAKLREEEEARRTEMEIKKAREREVKETHEKLKAQHKDQDRLRKEELKHSERTRKEAERAAKAELRRESKPDISHGIAEATAATTLLEKQTAREERPRAASAPKAVLVAPSTDAPAASADTMGQNQPAVAPIKEKTPRKLTARASRLYLRLPSISKHPKDGETGQQARPESPLLPDEPPTSKVKTWLKTHLRPRARSSPEEQRPGPINAAESPVKEAKEKRGGTIRLRRKNKKAPPPGTGGNGGFIGGAALAAASQNPEAGAASGNSSSSLPTSSDDGSVRRYPQSSSQSQDVRGSSLNDVALAGRESNANPWPATVATTTAGGPPNAPTDRHPHDANASAASLSCSSQSNNQSSPGSSSCSSSGGGGDNFVLASDRRVDGSAFSPPRPLRDPAAPGAARGVTKTGSPVRNSRFLEMMK